MRLRCGTVDGIRCKIMVRNGREDVLGGHGLGVRAMGGNGDERKTGVCGIMFAREGSFGKTTLPCRRGAEPLREVYVRALVLA